MSTKLTAFMTTYKFKKTDEEKTEFVKEHIKNEYVPIEVKSDIAKNIVNATYWRTLKDNNGNEYKEFYINSIAKYILTCISIVDLFTDIERQKVDDRILDDFNTLNSSGVLDLILKNIDSKELNEFNMLIEMVCNDVEKNEYDIHAFISKQVERFGELIGTSLAPVLDSIDLSNIQDIIDELK